MIHLQVDIVKLAEIIGACSVILGLILGVYKIYDKITDRLDALDRRVYELEKMANIHGWPCVNQAKGCCFNEFNAPYVFGDQAHPTDEGYALYGNSLANRIAAFYANRDI